MIALRICVILIWKRYIFVSQVFSCNSCYSIYVFSMCVFLFVCICVCLCGYVYVVYVCLCVHVYINVCLCVCWCVSICVSIYVFVRLTLFLSVCQYVCMWDKKRFRHWKFNEYSAWHFQLWYFKCHSQRCTLENVICEKQYSFVSV